MHVNGGMHGIISTRMKDGLKLACGGDVVMIITLHKLMRGGFHRRGDKLPGGMEQ